jgi:hypothetical protein
MRKLVPFALAIVLILAGGFYVITSRIPKPTASTVTGSTQSQTSQTAEADADSGTKIVPTTPKANQISLSITSPVSGTTLTSPSVTVKGTTIAYAEVSVNEKDVTASANGSFQATLSLEEGDNYIIVVAVDTDGNVAEQELSITYTPAE